MKSKLFLFLAILVFSFSLVAAEPTKLSAKTATVIDAQRVADLWAQADTNRPARSRGVTTNAYTELAQAPAVIEVVSLESYLRATMTTTRELPKGSIVILRVKTGGGTLNQLGFTIPVDGGYWSFDFTQGQAPSVLPGGPVEFQVIMMLAGEAQIYFASGWAEPWGCCQRFGPLTRASISEDGTTLSLTGVMNADDMIVTLGGQERKINSISYSTKTGEMTAKIATEGFEGTTVLTVCSRAECSSRIEDIPPSSGMTLPRLP